MSAVIHGDHLDHEHDTLDDRNSLLRTGIFAGTDKRGLHPAPHPGCSQAADHIDEYRRLLHQLQPLVQTVRYVFYLPMLFSPAQCITGPVDGRLTHITDFLLIGIRDARQLTRTLLVSIELP